MQNKIRIGSDFSGVGAFNQALTRLGVDYHEVFACDRDKYARKVFLENYGHPEYFPSCVYEREIPTESLDIYMSSPPCQAFSKAGFRMGKEDKRGILFFNSHEFIQKNRPRYFIFENVRGLTSDDDGKTFQEWINMLGGKSVNGLPLLFPYPDSVPYHIYYKVLNARDYGVPQNRERIFIVGIRDDEDNKFIWPTEEYLSKGLKDVLEKDVHEKYYLSKTLLKSFLVHKERHEEKKTGFLFYPRIETDVAQCLRANGALAATDNTICVKSRSTDLGEVYIKSATIRGYEVALSGDSVSLAHPNSKTRRGRVGRNIAQTLDVGGGHQGVLVEHDEYTNEQERYNIRRLTPREYFRLMDFPDTFTWSVSDSQAYKMAGNSIVVGVLAKIIKNLL